MKVEIDYRIEDLAEALGPKGALRSRPPLRSRLSVMFFGWVLFIGLAVMLFLLVQPSPRANPRRIVEQVPVEQDLWVSLVPSLLPASIVLVSMIYTWMNSYRSLRGMRIMRGKAPYSRTFLFASVPVLVVACMTPLIVPELSMRWHPSRAVMIWVAFAPWIVLYVILALAINRFARDPCDNRGRINPHFSGMKRGN